MAVSEAFESSPKEAAASVGFGDAGAYLEALVKADRRKRALDAVRRTSTPA